MRFSWKRLFRFPKSLIFLAIIISFFVLAGSSIALQYGPRKIIVMISDGCGYHHVDAEDPLRVPGALQRSLEYLSQRRFRVVFDCPPAGLNKMPVYLGHSVSGNNSGGTYQSEYPGVCRGDTQFVGAERPHSALDYGMIYPQQLADFGL